MNTDTQQNKETGKRVPRHPMQRVSDEEISSLLELAAAQVNGTSTKEDIELKKKEEQRRAEANRKKVEEAKRKAAEQVKAAKQREAERIKAEEKVKVELQKAGKKDKVEPQKAEKKGKVEPQKAGKKGAVTTAAKQKAVTEKKPTPNVPENTEVFDEKPYVMEAGNFENPYEEKWTFGRVMGAFFETIWTIFKIAVIIGVVTIISGFFLSRDLMIRGRNGARQCLEDMVTASNVAANCSEEVKKAAAWLDGAKAEKITMETDDGKILIARKVVTSEVSHKWAVILHGYGEDMEDIYDIAMHYSAEGYNILMPDLRAHGESEGSFYGMGWLDRLDVINWMDVILSETPSAHIVIHGVDMGADTALMLSGEPLKDNVKVIIAEGAYTSAWDVVKKEYKTRHPKLPVFPFLYMINPVMKVWAGYSLMEADATNQVKKTSVPILLIGGNNDTYADADMLEELNQSIASTHEIYTIVNGAHGDGRYVDTDAYYDRTFDFVERFVE